MAWLEDLLGQLQGGGAPAAFSPAASPFPDVPPAAPQGQAIWDDIEKKQREDALAADRRNAAGLARAPIVSPFGMPDQNSAGIQLAMDQAPAGTGIPGQMPPGGAPDGSPFGAPAPQFQPFGIPPSMQLASKMAAPPPPPMQPQAPVTGLNAPMGGAPPVMASDGAALPPNAVPAIGKGPLPGPAPMSPAGPPVAAPAEPSFMSKTGDFSKAIAPALLGIGAALQGDGGHLAAKMAADRNTLEQQTQTQNLTARALEKAGAPAADVAAAVKNPEMLKALMGQYYGKDKFKVVKVKDPSGAERVQLYNEQDGTFKDPPAGVNAPAGPPELNDAQKSRVQAIIDGREQYPSASSRAADAATIREAVHTQDPTFDAVNFKARQETRTKFTKGKGADNLTAFNTAIGHLGSLENSVDKLNNSGFPAWNKYVANPVAEQFDPKYQSGLKDFQTARTAVADELTRAFRGSGGNVHDIIQWENAINAADSPAALKSAIRSAAELLNSRIAAVGDEYNRGMGTTKDPLELLNPKAAESFKRILEGSKAPGSAPLTKGTTSSGVSWSIH